jgi:HEPN domain-containing protein
VTAEPGDWLAKAEADFGSMNWEMKAPRVNYDAVVFHAQQSIEKLMKAALTALAVPFGRTHELIVLAHLLKHADPSWTWQADDLAVLQPGAVLLRYPGYSASAQDAEHAVASCTRLRTSLLPFI